MAVVEKRRVMTDDELALLRLPRRDICTEAVAAPDSWACAEGPFRTYRRTLSVSPHSESDGGADAGGGPTGARHEVVERTEYKLALPLWWPYLWLLFRRAVGTVERTPRRRWWWPEEVVSAQTSTLIAHIGTIGMMAGFMGVVIGQTLTFAADDFGATDDVQANTLAAVRIGVLLSFLFLGQADRFGRRPLVLSFAAFAIMFTVLGAFAPNIWLLGGAQTVSRGLTTGLLTLITLASTEEVPASSRALSISFATLTTGFGAAAVIWVLPVAGLFAGGWRLIYLVPVLFVPLLVWVGRSLPETRRYAAAEVMDAPAPINWRRFAMVAAAGSISGMFFSPASQLRNEYLRDDLGFDPTEISAFQLAISIPATAAIPLAGILADRWGRKYLGAGLVTMAALMIAASYQSSGLLFLVTGALGVSLGAGSIPALRGYQTELFPTRARGRVGGMIDVLATVGSAIGLIVVGQLAVRWDDLGGAIAAMVVFPLIVGAIIVIFFPETAHKELEEFNPGDPVPAVDRPDQPSGR